MVFDGASAEELGMETQNANCNSWPHIAGS